MSKRNRNVEVEASEPAPVEGAVNEDGSPAGSAFGDSAVEDGEMDAVGNDVAPAKASEDGEEGSEGTEARQEPPPSASQTPPPRGEVAEKKALTRREEITARIAHIERYGGPIGRTQRVNDNLKELRAERDRQDAEWDREIAELRGQVTAMEKLQQAELEEARLLKIELAKLAE